MGRAHASLKRCKMSKYEMSPFYCVQCAVEFNNMDDLRIHLASHDQEKGHRKYRYDDEDELSEEEDEEYGVRRKPQKKEKSKGVKRKKGVRPPQFQKKKEEHYESDEPASDLDRSDREEGEDIETEDIKEARLAAQEAAAWIANEERRVRKKNKKYFDD